MKEIIRASDVVLHIPTDEKWVVFGVDYNAGEVLAQGYPFPTIVKLEECLLVESKYIFFGQTKKQIKMLKKEGLERFIDVNSAMFHEVI